LIFDNSQPTVWEVNGDTLKQSNEQKVIQDSNSGMHIYDYFQQAIPFSKNQYLITDRNYDLSLIQTQSCEALSTEIEDQLYEKTGIFFSAMQNALEEFSQQHNEKVGVLEISGASSSLTLALFGPRPLVDILGYNRNELMVFTFEFADFNIYINDDDDDNWPYDELAERSVQLAKEKLITSLLNKLSDTEIFKSIRTDKVYMLSNYYYPDIDRSALCVENVY